MTALQPDIRTSTSDDRHDRIDPFTEKGVFWTPDTHEEAKAFVLSNLETARKKLPGEAKDAIDQTEERVRGMFADYESDEVRGEEGEGRYGFMVANRNAIVLNPDNPGPDYSEEVRDYIPIGDFLDRNGCAKVLAGLPPNVVDDLGSEGNKGMLVFTPISVDAALSYIGQGGTDLDGHFGKIATATAEFTSRKIGRGGVIGLGAVLPKFTDMGRTITSSGIYTTTGHSGTLAAIKQTVEKVREEMFDGELPNGHIGILGAGAIGLAAAIELHRMYPSRTISVFDKHPVRSKMVAETLGAGVVEIHDSADALFRDTKVVVSALTSPLDPNLLTSSAEGVVIIDDSEPKSISNEDAHKLGVKIVGVTVSGNDLLLRRNRFNYGGWIGEAPGEVFACQAEAATFNDAIRNFGTSPDICVSDNVTAEDIAIVERLFLERGIAAARLQDSQGNIY